jgi:hypothetical protein
MIPKKFWYALGLWLLCGYLAAGIIYRDVQCQVSYYDSRRQDTGFALYAFPFGPLSLYVGLTMSGFAEDGVEWKWFAAPHTEPQSCQPKDKH